MALFEIDYLMSGLVLGAYFLTLAVAAQTRRDIKNVMEREAKCRALEAQIVADFNAEIGRIDEVLSKFVCLVHMGAKEEAFELLADNGLGGYAEEAKEVRH